MRCIELAKKGLGTTYPNPLVGCVIVHDNRIIGEGWHRMSGEPHAEVNAINSVQDQSLLENARLYVNLEPCSHFGKTPPCSHLIIEKGIRSVIVVSLDPNPLVSGKGIAYLENSECKVSYGVLEDACNQLNERFFTFHQKKRPYIILKWAQSKDGFIAPHRNIRNGKEPFWISNEHSRQLVHKWRAEEQAILAGTQTVIDDDPSLTTREWKGPSPIRIVIDRILKIPKDTNVLDGSVNTIVLTESKKTDCNQVFYRTIDLKENSIQNICEALFDLGIQSLIVEGGAVTLNHFIDSSTWDEARVFISDKVLYDGVRAPIIKVKVRNETGVKSDKLVVYRND